MKRSHPGMNNKGKDQVLGVCLRVNLDRDVLDALELLQLESGATDSDIINDAFTCYLNEIEKQNRETEKIVRSQNLLFTCPKCKRHRLMWAQIEEMTCQDVIIENGKVGYDTPPESHRIGLEAQGWHECGDCGYKIRNKHGDKIVEPEDVIEWLKSAVLEKDRF